MSDIISNTAGLRYKNGKLEEIDDPVVVEEKIKLYLNGELFMESVASNDSLRELGAGFFIASGIADEIKSVEVKGTDVYVEAKKVERVRGALASGGGFDPVVCDKVVTSPKRITPEMIFEMRNRLDTDIRNETGGFHCTVLYCGNENVAMFSDIGRHNTVDKAVGYMVLNGLDPSDCAIGCSGRQPFGMVSKTVNAGIPIVVSRAASTSAGAELAKKSGITLVCFVREGRFTVYSNPQRIIF